MKTVAVIGGGASGLMAALHAVKKNNKVILLEKQKKIGRKLLVTGNGRCNITNLNMGAENYNGNNPKFVHNIFSQFGLEDTIHFFQSIGLPFKEGQDGKMYPASLQASTVSHLFEYELKSRGVDVHLHRRVDSLSKTSKGLTLMTAGRERIDCDSVIIAAGSCAFPKVGASKIGYKLAESLGHTVYKPFAAILPVNIPLKAVHRLQGVKWDCTLSVSYKNKIIQTEFGELLFTAYGISGPVSLGISRYVNKLVIEGESPEIIVDFFPDLDTVELEQLLHFIWQSDTSKSVAMSLFGIINNKIPEVLLSLTSIDPSKKVSELKNNEKEKIVSLLKGFSLFPGEPRGFEEAVVAAGGVNVDEIQSSTMESKKVKGVYITGELLDIDGISGGYNLQFAWSTGAIAGLAQ